MGYNLEEKESIYIYLSVKFISKTVVNSYDYLSEEECIFGLSFYKCLEESRFELGVERGIVQ